MDKSCPECGGPLIAIKILADVLDAPSGINAFDCLQCAELVPGCGVSDDFAAWFALRNTERRARLAFHGLEARHAEILEMIADLARAFKSAADGRRMVLGPRVDGRWPRV